MLRGLTLDPNLPPAALSPGLGSQVPSAQVPRPTFPDWLTRGHTRCPPRGPPGLHGYWSGSLPLPRFLTHARLRFTLPMCSFIASSMGPHKPMFIHYPRICFLLSISGKPKTTSNSVPEHHMTAFVFQNEPRRSLGGGPWLPCRPQLEWGSWPWLTTPKPGAQVTRKRPQVCAHQSHRWQVSVHLPACIGAAHLFRLLQGTATSVIWAPMSPGPSWRG